MLLIDDTHSYLSSLAAALRSVGMQVEAFEDGVEAAQALKRGEFAAAAGLESELESVLAGDARFVITPLPTLHTGLIGQTYSFTPSVSNVTAAGMVCAWIDFNRNGVFETGERACTAIASGAPLTVTSTRELPARRRRAGQPG